MTCQVSDRCPLGYLFGMLQGSSVERTVPETCAMPSQHIIRVHTGQGNFFFLQGQGILKNGQGNQKFLKKSGNFRILCKLTKIKMNMSVVVFR